MGNNRFLKIVIIALLIINVSIVSFLWINRPPHFHQGPPPRQDVFAYLTRELQMDENQTQQYAQLRDEHHEAIEQLQQNEHHLREHFFALISKTPVDSLAIKTISDSIASTQEQIELVTFYHFQKVRAILKPNQQKHFDEIIQQTLRMMAPPPPK